MSSEKTRTAERAGQARARGTRAARAWADLTAQQLADTLGVGIRTVQRWESGQVKPPLERVIAVADACHVPVWFAGGADLPDNLSSDDAGERA